MTGARHETERDERGSEARRRFTSSEARAFDVFVRAHRAAVVRVAQATLGPGADQDAEDVAQEVLLRTFDRRGSLRSPAALRAWLARSTVHAAISLRRRARWRRPHVDLAEQVEAGGVEVGRPAAASTDPEDERTLRALVMRLPDHERVAVHLHYWMGHTSGEIADLLGCAEVTVRSRLLRARRRLHRSLQPHSHPHSAPARSGRAFDQES